MDKIIYALLIIGIILIDAVSYSDSAKELVSPANEINIVWTDSECFLDNEIKYRTCKSDTRLDTNYFPKPATPLQATS